MDNPITGMKAPMLTKQVLPTLTKVQVDILIGKSENTRDKASIAPFNGKWFEIVRSTAWITTRIV